jgi:glycosyltransferase involved in cell wall biosynthesis
VRILLLGRYSRTGASTRMRFLQYLPELEQAGMAVTEAPLFDDAYLRALYSGAGRSASRVLLAYWNRLLQVASAGRYDLLWIEKELFPRLPASIERTLRRLGVRYVVDYDDAVFHDYDAHPSAVFRWALSQKIDRVMRRATLVVAGNDYLADRARLAQAPWVETLPTVVDLRRYSATEASQTDFRVGWIGTPVTARYLRPIEPVLRTLTSEGATRVALVGAGRNPLSSVEVELRPWSEDAEVAEMRRLDVGVMPLPDGPWERGKCGYKLIQYMACGKPVVASPVGMNVEIVEHGVNGFLASTEAQWAEALRTLRDDHEMRRAMGRAGRARVEQKYSLQVTAPKLVELLRKAGS